MKTLGKFWYDKYGYREHYCRICGNIIKKDEPKMVLYIHQREIGICLKHFNQEIKDECMVDEL